MLQRYQQYFGSALSQHVWDGVIAFVTVMIVGFFLKYFLQTIGRKLIGKTDTDLDDRLLDAILPRIKWLAVFIGLYLAMEQIVKGFAHTDETGRQVINYTEGAIYLGFIYLITLLLIRLIDIFLKHLIQRHAQRSAPTLNQAVLPLLNRLTMILIVFIAVVIGLEHFGVNVSSLLVFLGGGSVAIALAAQETLANMIAGFVIMIDQPFRLGDRIKLPSGEIGDVYEIGLRSTNILDFDNNLIVSPNAELTKAKIVNYSYPGTDVRVMVEVRIAYGTNVQRAKEIVLELAHAHPQIAKKPAPDVIMSSMGDSCCILQLIARTDDWKKKGPTENAIREQIYTAFMKENISSGIAQHIIQVSNPIDAQPENRTRRTPVSRPRH
jgi:MscS family membrane protein